MYEVDHRYLKFVDFTQFEKWDVKRHYHKSNVEFSNEVVLLGNILKPYKKGINKEYIINNKLNIISKINFGGELFLRDFEEINTYKGNLFLVPENSIIYSKINVRHGCIYYHQKNETPFAVSNEYPIYTFDEKRIDGRFIQKLIRSNYFKNLLNTKTSGISKARVKQDEFLDIQIPLPSIAEQKAILDDYQQKIENAKQQETKAQNLEQSIEKYLFEELGIVVNKGNNFINGLKTISYKEINKWSLDDIFKKNSISSTQYPLTYINNVCELVTDGTHQTPTYTKNGIIFLSAKNVTKGVIDWDNIKYVSELSHKDYCKRVYPRINDILLAKNGTTGVAAIVDKDKEFSIYVSLALLRPNKLVIPMYLLNIINSVICKTQFDSRLIGIGVPNLHLGEIREVKIPLPPLEKQKEIAKHISAIKDNIKSLKQNAETLKAEAEKEFEEKIFN